MEVTASFHTDRLLATRLRETDLSELCRMHQDADVMGATPAKWSGMLRRTTLSCACSERFETNPCSAACALSRAMT